MTSALRAFFLLIWPLPALWACARAPYQYQPLTTSPASAGNAAQAAPQLLFVSFVMHAQPPGPRRIELLKAVTVAGEATTIAKDVTGPAYLLVAQLDAAGRPCGPQQRLPHPLLQQMEYPAEGNTGRLERRELALPEAEFFVRLARQPQATAVRVEEVNPATSTPVSATFPLNL